MNPRTTPSEQLWNLIKELSSNQGPGSQERWKESIPTIIRLLEQGADPTHTKGTENTFTRAIISAPLEVVGLMLNNSNLLNKDIFKETGDPRFPDMPAVLNAVQKRGDVRLFEYIRGHKYYKEIKEETKDVFEQTFKDKKPQSQYLFSVQHNALQGKSPGSWLIRESGSRPGVITVELTGRVSYNFALVDKKWIGPIVDVNELNLRRTPLHRFTFGKEEETLFLAYIQESRPLAHLLLPLDMQVKPTASSTLGNQPVQTSVQSSALVTKALSNGSPSLSSQSPVSLLSFSTKDASSSYMRAALTKLGQWALYRSEDMEPGTFSLHVRGKSPEVIDLAFDKTANPLRWFPANQVKKGNRETDFSKLPQHILKDYLEMNLEIDISVQVTINFPLTASSEDSNQRRKFADAFIKSERKEAMLVGLSLEQLNVLESHLTNRAQNKESGFPNINLTLIPVINNARSNFLRTLPPDKQQSFSQNLRFKQLQEILKELEKNPKDASTTAFSVTLSKTMAKHFPMEDKPEAELSRGQFASAFISADPSLRSNMLRGLGSEQLIRLEITLVNELQKQNPSLSSADYYQNISPLIATAKENLRASPSPPASKGVSSR